ncbi:MAG: hypothetical protein MZU97_10690 [Bacillus subtilis]|nr:hypothetical protein [Bacillus subtilis]
MLCQKTKRAAREYGVKQVIVAGGVAANRGLRAKMWPRRSPRSPSISRRCGTAPTTPR